MSQNIIVSSVIPEFDPLADDIAMWINVVEANARAFGWSDQMIKYQALQKLRKTAKTWYDSLQKTETSWTKWRWRQWRNTLLDTFETKRNMFSMLKDVMELKPLESQSLYEFYFQVKYKIDRLHLAFSEQDIISIIVGLIGDKNISVAAESGSFRYCDELASFLHNKNYNVEVKTPHRMSLTTKNFRSTNANIFNTKKQESNTSETKLLNKLTCFSCGEVGHKRFECKHKNLKCTFCNKAGHLEVACLSKPSVSHTKNEKDPEVKIVEITNAKEKFYKNITIDDHNCKAFFDMGSDCSLISSGLSDELGLEKFMLNKPVRLTGFTTDSVTEVIKAVKGSVKVDDVCLDTIFYIIDNLSGCNLLIGRNFTENKDIMYTRVGNNLLFKTVTQEEVRLIHTTMLKSDSQNYVNTLNKIFMKYPQCISNDLASLGQTSRVELDIELTTNKPISQRPYRMSESEKLLTREIIEDLLSNSIIRESNSPYASPVLLVDKSNGQKRLCIDYRQLNKITVKETYPMPIVEELIDRLKGCKYFTSLDLKSGYYQIKIKESSISKTAFITPDGHYEFLRMPFGLCNGPAVFQRLMNAVLGKIRFDRVICYMDDLLIATESLEDNIYFLEKVLSILQDNSLTINLEKCMFFQSSINFLGYDISVDGIRPGKKKLDAIRNYPAPQNIHQVRQFLGLINYFRKFIKQCAVYCKPLTKLLKKGTRWEWSSEQNCAVDHLKNELMKASLTIFDPKLPITLYTDASRDGLGCILMQETSDGEKPVHFYSRTTSQEEKQYHSYELEFLAITVGLKKFRHYLLGSIFKIVTDCNAVKYSLNKKDINSRIGRWVLQTQEFTFDTIHRPGTRMQHVDALSRNPISITKSTEEENVKSITITEADWLLSVQLQDTSISEIRQILESGQADENKHLFNCYELLGNKVYRRTEHGRRWVVPKPCIWQIIKANHDDIGHFSLDKSLERIKDKYWFPNMKKIVSKYIKNCINCIYFKNLHGKKPGKLFPIPKYARPFHTLHIDHVGPFVKTTKNNTHLFAVVDSFTKFVFISPVRNTTTRAVINELDNIFKIFGNPKRIVCDSGTAFTSTFFNNYCKGKSIRLHIIATAMPRGNGQVERYNQTILEALRSMGADMEDNKWDESIPKIQQGINSTINKTTFTVPSEILFGYRIQTDSDKIISDDDEQVIDVTALRKKADSNIQKAALKQKEGFDKKRKEAKLYNVGDLVVIKIPSQSNDGKSTKLLPIFKGPFQVIQSLGNDRYKVADMRGAERSSKKYEGIACVENMKPWINIADENEGASG